MQQRSQKFYEAVEKGLLPMDSTLTERANKVQAGAADRDCKAATAQADASGGSWGEEIQAFTAALRERLLGKDRVFSKKYLKLLVEETCYQNCQLFMKGSYAAVEGVAGEIKVGTPPFGLDWLPGQDSNLRPFG